MTARTVHEMEMLAKGHQRYIWYESVALMLRSQMLTSREQHDQVLVAIAQAQAVMERDTTRNGRIVAFKTG